MTWHEAYLSLQLEAEERIGARRRDALREAKALEDRAASAALQAISGQR